MIQNLSPGALARSGFSSQALLKENPGLIICNISGYGNDGEASNKRAYDLLVQAESGLISVSGSAQSPGRICVSICDIGAGMTAYSGILEALLRRDKTGRGEELSVSLFDVAADWMAVPFIHAEYGEGAPLPAGLRHPSIAPYGAFECADDRLVLISIQNKREWERLCLEVLASPGLFNNPDYNSNTNRVANRPALEEEITAITSTLSSEEFQSRLHAARIAFGAVNSAADLKSHAAFRVQEFMTTDGKTLSIAAHPVHLQNPAQRSGSRSPKLGEHTEAVLKEFSSQQT